MSHELWNRTTNEFRRANADKRHPFRWVALSTFGDDYPETRMVVNRGYDSGTYTFTFYTDSRSQKVYEIMENPAVSLFFYSERKKLQVRAKGIATLMNEGERFETARGNVSAQNPDDYNTESPPGDLLFSEVIQRLDEVHFTFIEVAIEEWDILQLSREGHSRLKVSYLNEILNIHPVIP